MIKWLICLLSYLSSFSLFTFLGFFLYVSFFLYLFICLKYLFTHLFSPLIYLSIYIYKTFRKLSSVFFCMESGYIISFLRNEYYKHILYCTGVWKCWDANRLHSHTCWGWMRSIISQGKMSHSVPKLLYFYS